MMFPTFYELPSKSPAMRRVIEMARRVAEVDTTLLLLGETGVGKEALARSIHLQSPRSTAPFVPINCAAVPDSLIESELFGHEVGAFTGAIRTRRGAFEVANRGTLLLDEIGDLPLQLQGKLLRALEERRIQRLGAEQALAIDVRIIAATHRDLRADIEAGRFRSDLFYRLSVVALHIPPLRDRRQDVRPLLETYLEHFKKRFSRSHLRGFDEQSLQALECHPWPGNVRELANAVERAVLLADGDWIKPEDLFESAPPTSPLRQLEYKIDLAEAMPAGRQAVAEAFERRYLDAQLQRFRGHLGDTAQAAGIDPRTLYNKMRDYGLEKESYRAIDDDR